MSVIIPESESIHSYNEAEMQKLPNNQEKLWDDLVKTRLGIDVENNQKGGIMTTCIRSKITSKNLDKDKFGLNSKLCNGNWQFSFDQKARLYLENIYTNIIPWKATRNEVNHYGSSIGYDINDL